MPKRRKAKAKKVVRPKANKLTAAQRDSIATQAKAAIDAGLDGTASKKIKIEYPAAKELAGAVWDLKYVVNKAVQKIYTDVLSATIIKLQHAKRRNIID